MKKVLSMILIAALIGTTAGCKHQPEQVDESFDRIPMVMVDDTLYLATGHESSVGARCGVMDGEITSTVDGTEVPKENNQSNFGTGYGYQYGTEGTIEILMDGKWWVYATEEARKDIQFPRDTMDGGIILSTKDVQSTGLTLVIAQSGGRPTGELQHGTDYSLEVLNNGVWDEVPYAIDGDVVWESVAYLLPENDTVELKIDWQTLYGSLENGTYRINKEFMDFRGAGDYDKKVYFAEFEIK